VAKAATARRDRSRRSTTATRGGSSLGDLTRELARRFAEHKIAIYASAIAFRALVALIPLVLLGLGILGAVGQQSVWHDSIAPAIKPRVTRPVFNGIDYSAEKILRSGTAPVITFATLLALWDLTMGVFGIMDALNTIHDVRERRPWRRRLLVAVALAAATAGCIVASVVLVIAAPKAGGGFVHLLFGVGRWAVAAILLGLAVGLVVRFAPAERPETRWASAGSVLVIGSWIVASLIFRVWVTYVANFKTAVGVLGALLVLTLYLFVSAAIFLIGAELDELLRKSAHGRRHGIFDLARTALGR
jgi:membrane protein